MVAEKTFRLPQEIPAEEYPAPEVFLDEAARLVARAGEENLTLRVMGPLALHLYFPALVPLYRSLDRLGPRVFTDIDFAAYGKDRSRMIPFFQRQGYQIEKRAMMIMGTERHIYFGGAVPMIDVFYDKLNYNHPISFAGRLGLHPQCISLADLLLQKLQIIQINDKDLKDAIFLLFAATPGDGEKGSLDLPYLTGLLSDDWGFWYTAMGNLRKVAEAAREMPALEAVQRELVGERVEQLLVSLDTAPKTAKWKRRAALDTRRPWYNEVSDWQ